MEQIVNNEESIEKALLVGVRLPGISRELADESIDELERLADTAGVKVIEKIIQSRENPDSAYFVGKGKAEEIAEKYKELELSTVIFDIDLSPAQTRNLENKIDGKVIDRTRLILDIFAQHARTKEAMLEVELAQLSYQLPRLTRLWTHLSRQAAGAGVTSGGVGTRGPGEKQLDLDRMIIKNKMSILKRSLDKVKENRSLERKNREGTFAIALVGYTNAGKSTLLNILANENLYTDDKLFATLDPVTRNVHLSDNRNILVTDTVGFIRNLPHHLIASFRATLEEVNESNMLLHVVDASHPNVTEQIDAVNAVLKQLGAQDIPTLMVLNKTDKIDDMSVLFDLKQKYPENVSISALNGTGLDDLKARLIKESSSNEIEVNFEIPQTYGQIINYIYDHGKIISKEFKDGFVYMQARMDRKYADKINKNLKELALQT
jgi:GTP-binding protein HflX